MRVCQFRHFGTGRLRAVARCSGSILSVPKLYVASNCPRSFVITSAFFGARDLFSAGSAEMPGQLKFLGSANENRSLASLAMTSRARETDARDDDPCHVSLV